MHAAADSIVGIGVQGILLFWLCIMEGLRYHTADIARKRADHQRQVMELRRAEKFLRESHADHHHHVTQYTSTYYDQYGDVDGSADTLN
eukprot:1624003-Ditylum_brightwellii.AAC.1